MAEAKAANVHERMEEHSKLFRDLLLGFVKVHVLHHASREPIYGVGISAELERHGYRLSPGTLYPLLHNLEAAEFLQRDDVVVGGKVRKYYTITPLGRRALEEARHKIVELVEEVMEPPAAPRRTAAPRRKAAAAGGRRR
ncbi:MAG: PadR family transcriptional regulator [Acidimicrobiales bacterium]